MQRLKLTPVNRGHAAAMYAMLNDLTLYRFTGGQPPEDIAALTHWFTNLESRKSPDGSEHWLTWIVQLQDTDACIGYVQATITGKQADIAWLIGSSWQGQGYAKEASLGLLERILHYPLDTVTAHIHPDHIASQQVATGLGLERSGQCQDGEEVWSAGVDSADKSGVHRSALEFNSRPS